MTEVKVRGVRFSQEGQMNLIAGPCQLETLNHARMMAGTLAEMCARLGIGFVFKASFDKANRTSLGSARGPGLDEGLAILDKVRAEFDCPVLTDVHAPEQCAVAVQAVDILQIPAFLCRQTDLLVAAAKTGAAINVKKGQFLAPRDMCNVVDKIEAQGNQRILLSERGASFGYNMLVSDMRSLPIMAETGYPVVFDATHSVQLPGEAGAASGGQAEFIAPLARAAVAVGVSAVFIETHQDPKKSPSDGPNMVALDQMEPLLARLIAIDACLKT